jgi:GNAT superfamily N-acetyltransferase
VSIVLNTPGPDELAEALRALRQWQNDETPAQLHPGDVGWYWRYGSEATSRAVRTWSRDGQVLALSLLDGADLVRLAIAPSARRDDELAQRIVADLMDAERGVLPAGSVSVEARYEGAVRDLLLDTGWTLDEPWTPLQRDLAEPVPDCGVRVEAVGPDHVEARVAVQRAAFGGSTFTSEGWRAMAAGAPYGDARCLVAYDDGTPVATATVWSAGPGRPGLLEPVGVHPDHRGRGHGTAITLAAAAALRQMGSSSAVVVTPSSLTGAVATYRSAGFGRLAEARDLRRSA